MFFIASPPCPMLTNVAPKASDYAEDRLKAQKGDVSIVFMDLRTHRTGNRKHWSDVLGHCHCSVQVDEDQCHVHGLHGNHEPDS